jgi:hypothetical protein
MTDWIDVTDSTRIIAMAYDQANEAILVRFPTGVEWQYLGCPTHVWAEFSAPATSKGVYINTILNHHTNSRYVA